MTETFKLLGAYILSSGAAALVLLGLSKWLGDLWLRRLLDKEKAELDLKTAEFNAERTQLLEKLRDNLSRRHYIFSKQYDKEFSVCEELWRNIVELYSAARALSPELDLVDPNQSEKDRRNERLTRYSERARAAKETILFNKPFYSQDVYKLALELDRICSHEAIDYQHSDEKSPDGEYWKDRRENSKKIGELADRICETIRERLQAVENDLTNKDLTSTNKDLTSTNKDLTSTNKDLTSTENESEKDRHNCSRR